MAPVKLTVHRLATREIHRAADSYGKEAVSLAGRFIERVEHAFMRIREKPYIGEMIERGERRLLVIRFPHKVIYRILPDRVVVVAVAHQRRRDGYWRRRKNDW
jgi:plasmid stabilization system protein ParE